MPKYGLEDEGLIHNFGFLWSSFEPRIYWWEVVDCVRKVGLVIIMVVVEDAYTQSLLGAVCVGFVMVLNYSMKATTI